MSSANIARRRRRGKAPVSPYAYQEWLRDYLIAQSKPANAIWGMDDAAGSTTMADLLSNHDGTFSGGPTLESPALVDDDGTSADLDGVDDYGQVPSAVGINPGTGSFTIFGWIEVPQSQIDGGTSTSILSKESGTNRYLIRIRGNNSGIRAFFGGDTNIVDPQHYNTITSGGTYLIALRVDRSTNVLNSFVNTQKSADTDVSTIGACDPTAPLDIGSRATAANGDYHEGNLDVCAYVPYALTDAELTKIYDVGISRSNR